jgi:hypothetical protein
MQQLRWNQITGKEFVMSGTEVHRDDMPFYSTSTKINIAGGYTLQWYESFAGNGRFAVKDYLLLLR